MAQELIRSSRSRSSSRDRKSRPPRSGKNGDDSDLGANGSAPHSLTEAQKASIRVLLVDDEESFCNSLASILKHEGYQITACTRGTDAEEAVRSGSFDIILLDLYMSGVSGSTILKKALEVRPDTIVVVMTGKPSVESSIQALRDGAWDYIPKPFSATHLQILMGRAAHAVLVARETMRLDELKEHRERESTVSLLGNSPAFRRVVDLAKKVAATDAAVFISGESGTGKEMVAQFIHEHSRRRSRSLVAVNCAAIPDTLLESEMFGHVQGAFTGAVRDKMGLMEAANGGTLFLDELSEMSTVTQAKLLRVIQDGVVRRVGSTKTDAVVNIRFIAATNRDPAVALRDGHLREDLYYRLRVVPIHIPPLRERPMDVPILARHFLARYWARHHDPNEPPPEFTEEALRALQQRPWKGNVRELENVIEHSVVLAEPGEQLGAERVPILREDSPTLVTEDFARSRWLLGEKYHTAREEVLTAFERSYLSWLLHEAKGNMSEAARIAGVDRTTLYRLLDKHQLQKDELIASQPDN